MPTQPITGAEDKGPRGAVPPETPEPKSFDPGKTGGQTTRPGGAPTADPRTGKEAAQPGAPTGAAQEGSDPAGASASEGGDDPESYPRAATVSDQHAQLGLAGSDEGRQRDRPPIAADDAGATAMAEAAAARKGEDVVDPLPPDAAEDVGEGAPAPNITGS